MWDHYFSFFHAKESSKFSIACEKMKDWWPVLHKRNYHFITKENRKQKYAFFLNLSQFRWHGCDMKQNYKHPKFSSSKVFKVSGHWCRCIVKVFVSKSQPSPIKYIIFKVKVNPDKNVEKLTVRVLYKWWILVKSSSIISLSALIC